MTTKTKSTKFNRISKVFIESLLSRVPLENVVDIDLKKAGSLLVGHCPFHNDKDASFTVYPDQHYHCYGCKATGNAIGYVMARDNLTFIEAVKSIAGQHGMTVEYDEDGIDEQTFGLYDVLAFSKEYYQKKLKNPDVPTQEFITKRGLTKETLEKFQIGLATTNSITADFKKAGFSEEMLLEAGLLKSKEGDKPYPFFRNRLMFPVFDGMGRVLSYTARRLIDGESIKAPKWINGQESSIFIKSVQLFNWYFAAKHCRRQVLVVEGALDAIMPAQYGVENIVASLGTALSEQQLKFLFKRTEEIVMIFDGDDAGQNAQWRAMEKILPHLQDGKFLYFVLLPQNEDPDSFVQQVGKEGFIKYVEQNKVSLTKYLLDGLKAKYGVETIEQVAAAKKAGFTLVNTMNQKTLLAQELKRQISLLSTEDPLVSRLAELRKKAPHLTHTELLASLMSEQAQTIEADPIFIEQEKEETFPVGVLGGILGDLVKSIVEVTQFPVALVAQGVLASATLAAQGVAKVQIFDSDIDLPIPISNLFCTLGESGEGKGRTDSLVLAPHRAWNEKKIEEFKGIREQYLNELEVWKEKVKEQRRQQQSKNDSCVAIDVDDKPKRPRQLGGILYESPSWEAIERGFINGKSSVGLFIEEGMRLLGDYAMSKDNQGKTSGGIIELWNNGRGARQRAQEEEYYKERAFAMHIAIQPSLANKYLFGNPDFVDMGLFSRMLIVRPASTQGMRPYNEFTPTQAACYHRYSQRITELLDRTEECADQETGELSKRRILYFGRDAKQLMVDFYNEIQGEIGNAETKAEFYRKIGKADPSPGVDGKYLPIRAFVNKGNLHAVRLAAVLQLIDDEHAINISAEFMERGIRLVRFYFNEALRLMNTASISVEQKNAQALLEWMRNPSNEKEYAENGVFKIRELQRHAPGMRDRERLLSAVTLLHHHSYGELFKVGRSNQFKLFPIQMELDCHTPVTVLSQPKATYHVDCPTVTTVTGGKNDFQCHTENQDNGSVTTVTLCQSAQDADYIGNINNSTCDNYVTIVGQTKQEILTTLNGQGIPLSKLRASVCSNVVTEEIFEDALFVLREEGQIHINGEMVTIE